MLFHRSNDSWWKIKREDLQKILGKGSSYLVIKVIFV